MMTMMRLSPSGREEKRAGGTSDAPKQKWKELCDRKEMSVKNRKN